MLFAVALLLVTGGFSTVQAQRVQITGGVPVVFMPVAADLAASFDCAPPDCLRQIPPAAELKILRQARRNQPLLRVSRTEWSGAGDLDLFARYLVDGNRSPPFTTDWFEIGSGVVELFDTVDANSRVEIEYQIRPTAGTAAGFYQTEVLYDGGPGSLPVSHPIRVELMPMIALRIDGAPVGAEATVVFDYALSPLRYLAAITSGELLPLTGGDPVRVEVFTNNPGGYRVTVALTQIPTAEGLLFPEDSLLLAGVPASERVFEAFAPTGGFETLLDSDDYQLSVDGSENPGSYRLSLTFTAAMLP